MCRIFKEWQKSVSPRNSITERSLLELEKQAIAVILIGSNSIIYFIFSKFLHSIFSACLLKLKKKIRIFSCIDGKISCCVNFNRDQSPLPLHSSGIFRRKTLSIPKVRIFPILKNIHLDTRNKFSEIFSPSRVPFDFFFLKWLTCELKNIHMEYWYHTRQRRKISIMKF